MYKLKITQALFNDLNKAINNYNIQNTVNVGAGAVVNVYGKVEEDFVVETGILKKYRGAATDVVVPDTVNEIGVVFANTAITSIQLPSHINRLSADAFKNCRQLKDRRITFSEAVRNTSKREYKIITLFLPLSFASYKALSAFW